MAIVENLTEFIQRSLSKSSLKSIGNLMIRESMSKVQSCQTGDSWESLCSNLLHFIVDKLLIRTYSSSNPEYFAVFTLVCFYWHNADFCNSVCTSNLDMLCSVLYFIVHYLCFSLVGFSILTLIKISCINSVRFSITTAFQ